MPKRCRVSAGPWLVIVLLLLAAGAGGCAAKPAPPRAAGGVMDLAHWNFARDGIVPLDGTWNFYWERLLSPNDFGRGLPRGAGTIRVPAPWNGQRLGGKALPAYGYATYELTVRLPPGGGVLAIYVKYLSTAYRLWADGRLLVANGTVGTGAATAVPHYRPRTAYFVPRGGAIRVVVQVANFGFRVGGMSNRLHLGLPGQVAAYVRDQVALAMLVCGAILIMGLYHLGLFLARRADRQALWLGIFCLVVALRTLFTGPMLLQQLFPLLGWEVELRAEYLSDYLILLLYFLFFRSLYPGEISPAVFRSAQIVGLVGGAVALLTPVAFSSRLIVFYEIAVVLYIVYAIYAMALSARRGRNGAWPFLAGVVFFLATVVNDELNYNNFLHTGQFIPLGFFVLLLAQAAMVADQSVRTARELRESRQTLTQREEDLRREVAEMLHGRVQTRLFLAEHSLDEARSRWPDDPAGALPLLAAARDEIGRVRAEDVRRASHLLHPTVIGLGLVPAAQALADDLAGHLRVSVRVDSRLARLDGRVESGLPAPVRLAAYRILEEALGNVCAHAAADRAEVFLGLDPEGRLYLRVQDDGRGVAPARLAPGLGLRCIAARAGEMDGRWEISGSPGRGTKLEAWLPLGKDKG